MYVVFEMSLGIQLRFCTNCYPKSF